MVGIKASEIPSGSNAAMDSETVVNLLANVYDEMTSLITKGPMDLVQGRLKFLNEILDAWDEENHNFNKQEVKTEYLDECGPNEQSNCERLIQNIMGNCSDNESSLILGTVSKKKRAMNSFSKNANYKCSSGMSSNKNLLKENSLMDSINGSNDEAVDLSLVDQRLSTECVSEINSIEPSGVIKTELEPALQNCSTGSDILPQESIVKKKRGRPKSKGGSRLGRPTKIKKESGQRIKSKKKSGSKQSARGSKNFEFGLSVKIKLKKNLKKCGSVVPKKRKRVKKEAVDYDSSTEENSEFESWNENSDVDDNVKKDPDFEIKGEEDGNEEKREQKEMRIGNKVRKPRKKRAEKGEKPEKKQRKKREKKVQVNPENDKEIVCCEHCGEFLPSQAALAIHSERHVGLASKPCQVCGKEFTRHCNLKRHLKAVHRQGTTKKYACDVCGKSFGRSDHLTLHKRFHTGEKPYLCTICGKGFYNGPHLKKHLFMHSGYKPYKCTLCSNGYVNKETLRQHTISVHGMNMSGEEVDVKALLPSANNNGPLGGEVQFSWRYEPCPIGEGGV